MSTVKRIALVAAAAVSAVAYVWVAAVRAVPGVRRRKAAARAGRFRDAAAGRRDYDRPS
ncbi:MAG TPA: hypothetical protein VFM41_11740 [Gaiella sp.]|nr:hypothetical protein [Gaiella sp.]